MQHSDSEMFEGTPVGVSSTIARVRDTEVVGVGFAGFLGLGGLIIGILPITAGCGQPT